MTFFFKVIIGWLILLALFLPQPIQADEPAHLSLQNIPLQDDRLLVVTVQLEDVVDLYGAEIQLHYDPAQLKVRDEDFRLAGVQIAPGPLLAFDDRFVAVNRVDSQAGLIHFVFTLLKPAPPINGEGVLATVVLEVTGRGPFALDVAQAKLVSSQLTAIPVIITNLSLDRPQDAGSEVALGTETALPPNYRGMIAGLLALLLALLLLFWLRSRRVVVTAGAGAPQPVRRIPGAGGSAQTSALLTEQGNRAAKQGDLAQAYERFNQAIELDPANAAAWLGKGLVAQQVTEKRICFQRALALDPQNRLAKTELKLLDTHVEGWLNNENHSLS
jgi:hypothetical protein